MLKLSIVTKRVTSTNTNEKDDSSQSGPFKTYLTKELQKGDLGSELSFQACITNLLSKQSHESYKSAFSANILVKQQD